MVDREQDVTYLIKPHKFSSTTATEVCHKYITHDLKSLETQFRTKCDNAFRCVKLAFNLNLTRLLYRIEYHSTVREAHLWAWWRYIYYNSSPVNLLSCQHLHYIFPLSIKSVVPQYFQYQFSPTIYVHWLLRLAQQLVTCTHHLRDHRGLVCKTGCTSEKMQQPLRSLITKLVPSGW